MSVETAQTTEKIDVSVKKEDAEPYYSEKTKAILRQRFEDIDAGKVVYHDLIED